MKFLQPANSPYIWGHKKSNKVRRMKESVKVFKFGGASIRDAAAIRNVAKILSGFRGDKLVVVVSAMGKNTDDLEEVVAAHARGDGKARGQFDAVRNGHYRIMDQLFESGHEAFSLVNDLFVEIDWMLEDEPHENYDYMYDQIVPVGELVSSRIVAAFLKQEGLSASWLDARDVVLTDNIFREGWVQWQETERRVRSHVPPMLEERDIVVTQGFIGSTTENFTTSLGRAGSDYSAAIFSYCLDAESMTIWKDVPGMLTADPRFFEDAVKLDRLSYNETIEMTYYGASVIHLKTIKPLQRKHIPVYVKSFLDPSAPWTCISDDVPGLYPPMIAVERRQAYLQISTRDYAFVAEQHLSDLFSLIASLHLQVNLMQNSAISFKLCVNDVDDKVDRFIRQINVDYEVVLERGLELITVRHDTPEVLDKILDGREVLFEKRIPETVQILVR